MAAKPLIDISIGISSMKNSKDLIPIIESLGYEYRPDFGGPNIHLFFAKGPNEKRTHYLHLLKYKGSIWNNDLLFRNYLIKHQDWADKYIRLKEELASKYADNRTEYTASKADFIHQVIKLAKEVYFF